jgi:hypothetical protein
MNEQDKPIAFVEPQKLPVQRYSVETVSTLLGPGFELRGSLLEDHHTPSGATQQFLHTRWQAVA